ncbi:hypothetical protein C8Q79DRAFT_1008887 [Trametes meyenii]|nr:hypothetical protein C8Q79DRAFT_1008887 [Trametes meyenii]
MSIHSKRELAATSPLASRSHSVSEVLRRGHPGEKPEIIIPAQRRSKRLRSESEEQNLERPSGTKSEQVVPSQYWYEDGNIILVADGNIGFRVHRSVLAQNSTIFRDMLVVSHPDDVGTLEECPTVRITDVASDIASLIQALYDGSSLFEYGERLAFSTVATLFELAYKYNIEHLRAQMLRRIRTLFCHQFSVFKRNVEFFTVTDTAERGLRNAALELVPSRDAIRAVNLVRLADDMQMLPIPLYLCSTFLDAETLVSGTTLQNGRKVRLAHEDLVRCLDARRTLALRAYKARERILCAQPAPGCTARHKECATLLEAWAKAIVQKKDPDAPYNALGSMQATIKKKTLCAVCMDRLLSENTEGRRYVWQKMPEDLGLQEVPGWEAQL